MLLLKSTFFSYVRILSEFTLCIISRMLWFASQMISNASPDDPVINSLVASKIACHCWQCLSAITASSTEHHPENDVEIDSAGRVNCKHAFRVGAMNCDDQPRWRRSFQENGDPADGVVVTVNKTVKGFDTCGHHPSILSSRIIYKDGYSQYRRTKYIKYDNKKLDLCESLIKMLLSILLILLFCLNFYPSSCSLDSNMFVYSYETYRWHWESLEMPFT